MDEKENVEVEVEVTEEVTEEVMGEPIYVEMTAALEGKSSMNSK